MTIFKWNRIGQLTLVSTVIASLLTSCGGGSVPIGSEQTAPSNASTTTTHSTEQATVLSNQAATRPFTDWTGHTVEVPAHPQRIIYHGETTGDLLALGITPVGILHKSILGTTYENRLSGSTDIGFPFSVEKAVEVDPDLIIIANNDETVYTQVSKIAPTVTFDSFASLPERMRVLGKLFGKEKEAEQWLERYTKKEKAMWNKIREQGVKPEETASVITMYPGNRLFVMVSAGLPQLLYGELGFKPVSLVQDIVRNGTGFMEISLEKLPEYAGDRIFILKPIDASAKKDSDELLKSKVWTQLPAVKNGHVYEFDINKAGSDATSREWLLDELPRLLQSKS
ncbi:ABC transporter substrate-binding protein [Paenibacillus sp.]|uniref:ABC transporter substrate-binding protein n=1 Tax=Paenibacillus sp. TaxID=58172 RepID=UPI003463A55C